SGKFHHGCRSRGVAKRPPGKQSTATVNHHLQLLRAILLRAVNNRRLRREDVPPIKLENPNNKRVRYLTDEEEMKLRAQLPEWFRPLITLAIHTGMRKGELQNLKWQDVDLDTLSIRTREAKSGEGTPCIKDADQGRGHIKGGFSIGTRLF